LAVGGGEEPVDSELGGEGRLDYEEVDGWGVTLDEVGERDYYHNVLD